MVHAVFSNLANSRTSQFQMSRKRVEYQNVKIVKSKFRREKSNKNKYKTDVVLKENQKKENTHVCYVTFKYLFILCIHACEHYNSFITKYI